MKIRAILGALVLASLPAMPALAENMTPEDIKKLVEEAVEKRRQEHERRDGGMQQGQGEAASAPHLRGLPVSTAAWLAAVAHVRHQWTDYHQLLDDGYDRDSARFFVINQTNAKLTEWRATRLLDPDGDEE